MSAHNYRLPIHAGGVEAVGFLSPTIHYNEYPLSDDIQKTEDAANLNMGAHDAMGQQHGQMAVLGAGNAVEDAANGAADAAASAVGDAVVAVSDAAVAADNVGPSSSSSSMSSFPTDDHVESIEDGADVEMEDVNMEEEGGQGQEEAQAPLS
ncbi:hypothetical protein BGZ91_003053 [Linnemannia elongata]|nr:hypothetical protein BGZ91_003053 [Linnemannia elongata]